MDELVPAGIIDKPADEPIFGFYRAGKFRNAGENYLMG
jgi:hypothetical protein